MKKTVLITGATSGIGKACAEKFAANGFQVIITGRRETLLREFSAGLSGTHHAEVIPLPFDITKREQVEKAIKGLSPQIDKIDILINNAGLAAGLDPVDEGNVEDWEQMIDTNIKGLLYITRCVLPIMKKYGKGHIINIGSNAGREIYPNGNVYCASKHAVDALSKGMRIDLLKHGIKVTQVLPGTVETEFALVRFKQDKVRAKKIYQGYRPLEGYDVAEVIYYIASLPEHMNVNDITIVPANQATTMHFHRV